MTSPAIDLAALRAAVEARSRDRTHSPGCYLWSDHRDCAIIALLDRLAAAEAVVEAARYVADWDGDPTQDIGISSLIIELRAFDRAIAGQQPREEGT